MGSFNLKCCATGQVIANKDRCRIAVVLQAASYSPARLIVNGAEQSRYAIRQYASTVTSMWEPMTAFMCGQYDDMALVKLDRTPENQTILAVLFNELYREAAVTLEGDKDNRGMAFDFQAAVATKAPKLHAVLSTQKHFFQTISADELDLDEAMALWDFLQDGTRDNRVYVVGGSEVLRQLEMSIVHEASFRHLVAVAEGLRTQDGAYLYARKTFIPAAFKQLQAELVDVVDDSKRFFRKDDFRNKLHFCMDRKLTRPVHGPFRDILEEGVDLVIQDGQPVAGFLKRCKVVLDCLYAFKGLEVLNIQLTPLIYMGQDNENFTGQKYADFVADTAKEISVARKRLNKD